MRSRLRLSPSSDRLLLHTLEDSRLGAASLTVSNGRGSATADGIGPLGEALTEGRAQDREFVVAQARHGPRWGLLSLAAAKQAP